MSHLRGDVSLFLVLVPPPVLRLASDNQDASPPDSISWRPSTCLSLLVELHFLLAFHIWCRLAKTAKPPATEAEGVSPDTMTVNSNSTTGVATAPVSILWLVTVCVVGREAVRLNDVHSRWRFVWEKLDLLCVKERHGP